MTRMRDAILALANDLERQAALANSAGTDAAADSAAKLRAIASHLRKAVETGDAAVRQLLRMRDG